jgi:hypothetical protein
MWVFSHADPAVFVVKCFFFVIPQPKTIASSAALLNCAILQPQTIANSTALLHFSLQLLLCSSPTLKIFRIRKYVLANLLYYVI